jgi:hypothetical protein
MHRSIKLAIASIAALALAVPAAANASVSVDDAGAGFVGKGDVQTALGLANDAAMQDLFKKDGIKFTMGTERSLSTETKWKCGTGTNSQTSTVRYSAGSANATANTNGAGKLTNGWNLAGSTGGMYLGGERTGAPYVGYCASGAFGGFLPHVFSETGSTTGLYVNGVALPNTPVEVAPTS